MFGNIKELFSGLLEQHRRSNLPENRYKKRRECHCGGGKHAHVTKTREEMPTSKDTSGTYD